MTAHQQLTAAVLTLATVVASESMEAQSSGRSFISPLPAPILITPDNPRYPNVSCRELYGRQCPPVLVYRDADGPPAVPPALKGNVPNLHVSFRLVDLYHQVIVNGGVSIDEDTQLEWNWHTPAVPWLMNTWVSIGYNGNHEIPAPGDTHYFSPDSDRLDLQRHDS